jgi:hypothetical protein
LLQNIKMKLHLMSIKKKNSGKTLNLNHQPHPQRTLKKDKKSKYNTLNEHNRLN